MTDPAPFPPIDALVIERIADLVPPGHIGTSTPPNLAAVLPFIRAGVRGGSDDGVTDHGRVDTEYFAATYVAARNGAEAIRQRLSTLYGPHVLTDGVIDSVASSRAQEVKWADNGEIRRFVATHTVDTRRNYVTA